MLRFFIVLLCLQGVLMSNSVEYINVKNVDIPMIYEEQKMLPIVFMQIVFVGGGSINDGKKEGLARFTSKVLNEGTSKMQSSLFAKELEEKAITLNVHSDTEMLVFELSSLKENIDFGALRLRELLVDPNLHDHTFEKVRIQTLGTILSKQSDFDYVASSKLKELMFENTPLGTSALGTEESINAITKDDVRGFLSSYVNLQNAIVVIGGDISKKEAFKLAEETLAKGQLIVAKLKTGKKVKLPHFEASNTQKSVTQIKDTEQAYVYFGAPLHLKVNDGDLYKLKVAGFILGDAGFGSRLMEEIRVKRGLAYSAYAKFNVGNSSSYMSGYLQTKNENKDEAKKLVKEVIEKFVKNGVHEDELLQAKKFLLGSEPLRLETLSQRLSRSFSEFYSGREIGHTQKELKQIEELSLEELNSFIVSHDEITKLIFSIVTNEDNRSKR